MNPQIVLSQCISTRHYFWSKFWYNFIAKTPQFQPNYNNRAIHWNGVQCVSYKIRLKWFQLKLREKSCESSNGFVLYKVNRMEPGIRDRISVDYGHKKQTWKRQHDGSIFVKRKKLLEHKECERLKWPIFIDNLTSTSFREHVYCVRNTVSIADCWNSGKIYWQVVEYLKTTHN